MTLFESIYACRLLEQKTKKGRIVYHGGEYGITEFEPHVEWNHCPAKWEVPATFFSFNKNFALSFLSSRLRGYSISEPSLYKCRIKKDLNLFNINSFSELKELYKQLHSYQFTKEDYELYEAVPLFLKKLDQRIERLTKRYNFLYPNSYQNSYYSNIESSVIPYLLYRWKKSDGSNKYDGFVATETKIDDLFELTKNNQIMPTYKYIERQNIALFRPMECITIEEEIPIDSYLIGPDFEDEDEEEED